MEPGDAKRVVRSASEILMGEWLQFGIVLLVVGGAASYLALRAFSLFRLKRAGACGSGCAGCPKSVADTAGPALIQLEDVSETSRR